MLDALTTPDRAHLFPYQVEGVAFLRKRNRALLADEMGLGKSAQVIDAVFREGVSDVLIVCPASLRINWSREFDKFHPNPPPVYVVNSGATPPPEKQGNVVVVSYDSLRNKKIFAALMAREWAVLVLDEAHYVKNAAAKRTQKVYGIECDGRTGLASRARRVWALTGTPAPNHPGEIWTHMRALAPNLITDGTGRAASYMSFLHRYCVVQETTYGPKVVGGRNFDELRAKLKPWVLQRKKADVLKDLPEMLFSEVSVEAPCLSIEKRAALFDDARAQDIQNRVQSGLPIPDDPHMASLRREIGLAKIPGTVEFALTFLSETTRKLVIFAHHREVMLGIEEEIAKNYLVVRINGDTPPHKRQEAVDSFQGDPACRVFLGQIQAAGTGLTLTAASDVLFAELSWTPADNAQAAARVHRIGQNEAKVHIRFATLADTLDEVVVATLRRKTALLKSVFQAEGDPTE